MNAPAPTNRAGRRGHAGVGLAIAATLCLLVGGAVWIATRRDALQRQDQIALLRTEDSDVAVDAAAEAETPLKRGSAAEKENQKTPSASPAAGSPQRPQRLLDRSASMILGESAEPAEGRAPAQQDQLRANAGGYGGAAYGGSGYDGAAAGAAYGSASGGGMGGGMGGTARDYYAPVGGKANRQGGARGRSAGAPAERRAEYSQRQRLQQPADELGYGAGAGYGAGGYGSGYGGAPEADQGQGPGRAGDHFEPITDNPFLRVVDNPLSTFSIDVDTASYSKVRQYLLEQNALPRPDAVRIEELINYFDYDYPPPADDAEHPFAASIAVASCPWNPDHRLARIGIQGRTVENDQRPASNLVFLLDVSGSMNQPNRLPLVRRGMQMLVEQLGENDRVAIVVYAGAAGRVLDSTPADRRQEIFEAIDRLRAGGSTNGGQGIQLAYATARDHFISGGTNRVILCTDGDFNVGTTGTDQLVRMVEKEAKGGIFLTVLGFGMGNHNDAMLEQISGRGNGNYAFIDTENEAHKVLVQQTAGTLVAIAKDVKIQVEFNPNRVAGYRLIGYENRLLAKEDFNDDTKDAGEIGAGHAVTALYELVPAGEPVEAAAPDVDPLRYQTPDSTTEAAESDEVLTLKLRYKPPEGDQGTLVQFPAEDDGASFDAADRDFQFAAAVAGFGMLLRDSPYKGNWTFSAVGEIAGAAQGEDAHGFRGEFLRMVDAAAPLAGE